VTRASRASVILGLAFLTAALVALGAAPLAGSAPGDPGLTPAGATLPRPQARAWIVTEADTGEVVGSHLADQPLPIASTTKLMTALLTLERLPLDRVVAAAVYHPLAAESVMGLRTGERLTVADLLRGLLLPSANDAAETLADAVAGSVPAFVSEMNARARQLGLAHTHYSNPVGLDSPSNYSSAADLVTLARRDLTHPFFAQTVALRQVTLASGDGPRTLENRNLLLGDASYVRGVKTGHTSGAGYVLVGLARRHGVDVLSAALGDPTQSARDADSLALLRYGLAAFARITVVHAGQVLARPRLSYRGSARTALVASRGLAEVLRRGARPTISLSGVPSSLSGPVAAGHPEGVVIVRDAGRELARAALVTQRAVAGATLGQRLRDFLSRAVTLVLLAALVGCSLLLVLLRRRATRRRLEGPPARRRTREPIA